MRRMAFVGIMAGVICAAPARAQMSPWGMQAQLQLQRQWQRQQMRQQHILQQQLRSQRSLARRSTNSSRKALSSSALARQRAAEMRRLLQWIHKEQQHRLALLRRITVARQNTLKRIQQASSRAQPTRMLALQRTSMLSPPNTPQLHGTEQASSAQPSSSRSPANSESAQMAALLNQLAPLMFLHGRENPPAPSNVRPRSPAPPFVRVAEPSTTAPARKRLLSQPPARSTIVRKPTVLTSSAQRTPANLMSPAEAENVVMQLVLRIGAGEFRTRRGDHNETSGVQPDKIKQAPPRPVLASEHPIPVWPNIEVSPLAASSRPSLVEVVRQPPSLLSLP